jgi:hypothetical protein
MSTPYREAVSFNGAYGSHATAAFRRNMELTINSNPQRLSEPPSDVGRCDLAQRAL